MTKKDVRPTVLLVDDERGTRDALSKIMMLDYKVTTAEDGEVGLNLLERNDYDLVLTDIRMPGADGFAILEKVLSKPNPPPCIMLTAYGSIESAVDAMRKGAFDFVTKPVRFDRLELIMKKAIESKRIIEENIELKKRLDHKFGLPSIIGTSAGIKRVIETVQQVAPTRATVLIEGESGTGKELIAQALHQLSGRTGKFVPVHCAALPETLLESELFGHERGAFTGAAEARPGRFEMADGGTLFLDEIGEIPLSIQIKLLRVLETRSFERLGGTETIKADVRIVAATNKNLEQMVAAGTFREDLFYRLNVVSLDLPPLRERKDDIPPLVHHYINLFAGENGKENMTIDEAAMTALTAYAWHGNIRELRNCVERMVVLCRGHELTIDNVPANIRENVSPGITKTLLVPADGCDLEKNEKLLIERALNECGGNRSQAAVKLGISRRTLHRKLNLYNIE